MSSTLEVPWGLERLQELHRVGATGTLQMRSARRTDLDVYLMDGELIGCARPADPRVVARLLVNGRAIDPEGVEALFADPELDQETFIERLLDRGLVSPETLQSVLAERFRENVYAVAEFATDEGAFAPSEAVFPPDVQLGFPTERLIEEAILWFNLVRSLLEAMDREEDPAFRVMPDLRARRPRAGAALLALMGDGPVRLSELLARSPMSGSRTLEALAILSAEGLVVGTDGEPSPVLLSEEDRVAAIIDDGEPPPGEDPGGDSVAEPGPAEPGQVDASSPPARDGDEDGVLDARDAVRRSGEDTEVPQAIDVEDLTVDYDEVTRGAFVQRYEVHDVVDLSGIDDIPGVAAPLELVEIGVEGGDVLAMDEDDEPPVIDDGGLQPADPLDDVLRLPLEGQPPSGDDTIDEYHIVVDEDEEPVVQPRRSGGGTATAPAEANGAARGPSPLTPEQVRAFQKRIGIFNSIFQIIYRTFSAQIGPQRTLQRFNRFLGDESLQYPGLFRRLRASSDGSLNPSSLVRNVAEAHSGDPAAFLHQGLYELIYVHLYDAKDILPPDVERDMMDQIDAFEQRLHGR